MKLIRIVFFVVALLSIADWRLRQAREELCKPLQGVLIGECAVLRVNGTDFYGEDKHGKFRVRSRP